MGTVLVWLVIVFAVLAATGRIIDKRKADKLRDMQTTLANDELARRRAL